MFFHEEVAQEGYFQQRRQFRAVSRTRLQDREGLPAHDGERYLFSDGGRFGLAVGKRKGVGAGLPIAEGLVRAGMDSEFDLFVSNPFDLAREVVDLDRDVANYALGEAVDFGVEMPKGFDFAMPDDYLTDEGNLDAWLQYVNARLAE